MTAKIWVLVIDDSTLSRRLLNNVLSTEANIVTITAPNGAIGLDKIAQYHPDLITLDVEMPEMDGLETLKAIREGYADIPVIMFSRYTEHGASVTTDALFHGANDFVTKPTSVADADEAIERVRQQLVPKIRALCTAKMDCTLSRQSQIARQDRGKCDKQRVDVVVIGSSTGGPNALADLIGGIPANFPVPILIVQHTLPLFSKYIADRLNAKSVLSVREAKSGDRPAAGEILLAPGDRHMNLECEKGINRIKTFGGSVEDDPKPSVDILFNSVAQVYRENTLAIVLTGMGKDGLEGCRAIRQQRGQVLVQDKNTSVVWGMPGSVANAGLADEIVPLEHIAENVMRRVNIRKR